MRITVRNLGVLKEAAIDLKPLTIFVGPNNAGKTWLAYVLAGIFGPYGYEEYVESDEQGDIAISYPSLENALENLLKTGSATIDLVQFADDYAEQYFNNVARSTSHWMPEFMGSQVASFDRLDISIALDERKKHVLERVLNFPLRREISGSLHGPSLSIRKKRGERTLSVYMTTQFLASDENSSEEAVVEPPSPDIIKEFLLRAVFEVIHRSLYPHIRILPTERTTFITLPFRREVHEESAMLKEKLSEQETRAVLAPVVSFLHMISSTFDDESAERAQRARSARTNPQIREYIQLAQLLEKQILHGAVKISPAKPVAALNQVGGDSSQEILFQPDVSSQLEIAIASSMAKELSPLVLYLRYLVLPDELLIIDEPEMNLHPEAQAKITEFLAMLVNAGLNILVTTHSPYVVDHLANLLKAAEKTGEEKEAVRDEFYLQRTDAFIPKDKVSVYLIEEGTAKNALDEDGAIQWNTFGDVSDRISEIYFKTTKRLFAFWNSRARS